MNNHPCKHCGVPTDDTLSIKRKWVSWGSAPNYQTPLIIPCHKSCKSAFLDERAKWFAVLDETMNTHRDFVRVKGQDGYVVVDGRPIKCKGWQSANEIGVPYIVSDRYAAYY